MKVTKEHYELIKPHYFAMMKKLLNPGFTAESLSLTNKWNVYHFMREDLLWDDSHPFYSQGLRKRRIPHKPEVIHIFEGRDAEGMKMLSNSYNDSHIETMLKKLCKEFDKNETN